MIFTTFEEQVFLITTLIENLTDDETGTGFLVQKPHTEQGKLKFLLFSNKHVFWGKKDKDNLSAKKKIQITLHKSVDGSENLGDRHRFVIDMDRKGQGYYDHPNIQVDVACANISDAFNKNINLKVKAVSFDDASDLDRTKIYSGERVLFVGYPIGFYDVKNFLPVCRTGTIASIPSVDFNGLPQILIDAQVFPGSSGSPVFTVNNGRYKLLGIISDGFHKEIDFTETIIASNANNIIKIPREWVGLGLLFTVDSIKEVYNLA